MNTREPKPSQPYRTKCTYRRTNLNTNSSNKSNRGQTIIQYNKQYKMDCHSQKYNSPIKGTNGSDKVRT